MAFLGFSFAIALYHLFLYIFAARERSYLLFVLSCLPMITRFVTIQGGLAELVVSESALPVLYHISEVSLILFYIMSVWFTHELIRLTWGGKVIRAIYVLFFEPRLL